MTDRIQTDRIQLRSVDGFALGAYQARPESGNGPRGAVVVIQEVFGVNDHIREVVEGYAAAGYFAIAPQIFDRIERDIELGYQEADMATAIELAFQKLDHALALQDVQAAVDAASAHGPVGVVGYCFGGLLTWRMACRGTGVAAAVAYYGGGIGRELDQQPACPTMMHFGEQDAHIPMTQVEEIKAAHPEVAVHVYPADHGFNCDHRASFDADSAALARERTLAFFADNLS